MSTDIRDEHSELIKDEDSLSVIEAGGEVIKDTIGVMESREMNLGHTPKQVNVVNGVEPEVNLAVNNELEANKVYSNTSEGNNTENKESEESCVSNETSAPVEQIKIVDPSPDQVNDDSIENTKDNRMNHINATQDESKEINSNVVDNIHEEKQMPSSSRYYSQKINETDMDEIGKLRLEVVELKVALNDKLRSHEDSMVIIKSQQDLIKDLHTRYNAQETKTKKDMEFYLKQKTLFRESIDSREANFLKLRAKISRLNQDIQERDERIRIAEEYMQTIQQSLERAEQECLIQKEISDKQSKELQRLSDSVVDLKTECASKDFALQKLQEVQEDKFSMDEKLAELQKTLLASQDEMKKMQFESEKTIHDLKLAEENLKSELNSSLETIQFWELKSKQQDETISELNDRVFKAEDVIHEHIQRLAEEEGENEKHRQYITQLKEEISKLNIERDQRDEGMGTVEKFIDELNSALTKEKAERQTEKVAFENRIEELSSQNNKLSAELQECKKVIEEWKTNAEKAQEHVINLKNIEIQELRDNLHLMEKDYLNNESNEILNLKEKLSALQIRLEATEKELKESNEDRTNLQIQLTSRRAQAIDNDLSFSQSSLEMEEILRKNHDAEVDRLMQRIKMLEQQLFGERENDLSFSESHSSRYSNVSTDDALKILKIEQLNSKLTSENKILQNEIDRLRMQIEKSIIASSVHSFSDGDKGLDSSYASLKKENSEQTQKIASLMAAIQEKTSQIQEERIRKEIEVAPMQKHIALLKSAIESRDTIIEQQRQRIQQQRNAITDAENLVSMVGTLESVVRNQKEQNQNQKKLLRKAQMENSSLQKEFDKERAEFASQMEYMHVELMRVAREGSNETQELNDRMKLQEVSLTNTIDELRSRVEILTKSLTEARSQRDSYQEQLSQLQLKFKSPQKSKLYDGFDPDLSTSSNSLRSTLIDSKSIQKQINELIVLRREHEQSVVENQFYIASIKKKLKNRYFKICQKETQVNELRNSLRRRNSEDGRQH